MPNEREKVTTHTSWQPQWMLSVADSVRYKTIRNIHFGELNLDLPVGARFEYDGENIFFDGRRFPASVMSDVFDIWCEAVPVEQAKPPLCPDTRKAGNIVQIHTLHSTVGILASPEHLAARREGAQGRILSVEAMDTTGDIWLIWVQHGDTVAPYWDNELGLIGELVR